MWEKIGVMITSVLLGLMITTVWALQQRAIKPEAAQSTTISCWPDESALECWRRAEHRMGDPLKTNL
jgi:hypothetical protein